MEKKPQIILDPKDMVILSAIAKISGGDHNNSQINNQEIEKVSLEQRLRAVELDVSVIKSNYLTKGTFYRAGGAALISLIVTAGVALWSVYSNIDGKLESRFVKIDEKFTQVDQRFQQVDQRFQQVDQRFQQIENKIHGIDIRLTKVELRLDNIESKVDSIDDKLDILIQQHTKK
ncbi:DUF2730 family protein [Pasteurella multocida]|uniref:DUF2730 family protein n=2 Tax=Pasteurella multocida TaxID=747 RepID=UPI0002F65C39|nr:DUF2730 family protein [Pasteurella multocida]AXN95859.1 DUF2730 family protein [Pasteurella multocida]AXN99662.1 DUF2730 family protein [Pasteurella multocida]AXO01872.1 DUF2730 family protein [Pasteurella multocida]AXO04092.1 DUF2730 family protein [Pasteurella multocida]MCW4600127.1 DUF2730 family protein [Pasteurella multocida subsp. multocida]